METIGIRELKNRLSEFIRLVRKGARVQITDRGEVVAELRPPSSPDEGSAEPGLTELQRVFGARIGAPNNPDLYTRRRVRTADGTALRLLDDDRGER